MIPAAFEKQFYAYLDGLVEGKAVSGLSDLEGLSSRTLLLLADKIREPLIPLFVHILKSSEKDLFEKLMGDHNLENKSLVDSFFNKYQNEVLTREHHDKNFNPLLVYLPPSVFDDLNFVQSRQKFFERQRSDVINTYFESVFGELTQFVPGEESEAWKFFWNKLLKTE